MGTKGWHKRPRTQEHIERDFWRKVAIGNHCWEWKNGKNESNGYGTFLYEDKTQKAHRVSWMINRGAIPAGFQVLHECDNPACVRPSHLFLGFHLTNMRDRARKGRQHNQKLSRDDILQIRDLCGWGFKQKECAALWGVSKATINDLVLHKTWSILPCP